MADADFVGQQLVTRNQDGTFGSMPTDELVTWKLKVTRIKLSELVGAEVPATAPIIVPAPGAGKFVVLNQIMVLPRAKTGTMPNGGGAVYPTYLAGGYQVGYAISMNSDGVVTVTDAAIGQFDASDYAVADILNSPIVLSSGSAFTLLGTIFASAISAAGTGWVQGDTFEIVDDDTGASSATGVVDSVNAGGIVDYTITNTFPAYDTGVHLLTATSGVGIDASLDILAVDTSVNTADYLVYAWYSEVDTLGY